MAAVAKKSV